MAGPSNSSLLSSLLEHSSKLAALFKEAERIREASPDPPDDESDASPDPPDHEITLRRIQNESNTCQEVEAVVDKLVNELIHAQGPYVHKSVPYVMAKVEQILEEFMNLGPRDQDKYKKMVTDIKTTSDHLMKPSYMTTSSSSSLVLDKPPIFGDPVRNIGDQFDAKFERLSLQEKQCVLWFSRFPSGEIFNKRELIQWWHAMDLIGSSISINVNDILGKLRVEGFINRATKQSQTVPNTYMMHPSVHSKLKERANFDDDGFQYRMALLVKQNRSPCIINTADYQPVSDTEKELIQALINIGEHNLSIKIFDELSRMKNVRVLHLGSLQHNRDTDYILVDKLNSLRDLTNLVQVKYLSLQGISGITELPSSIFKLRNIKYLNLKACNSLMSLPQGIEALQQLTYLDMSKCYQLDHVPKGITSLFELKVLKGFVINPDSQYQQEVGDHRHKAKHESSPSSSSSSSCVFSELSALKQLTKLTIRSRRINFPTRQDLYTLSKMEHLNDLGITWVGTANDQVDNVDIDEGAGYLLGRFLTTLEKLKFQAVPKRIGSRLLGMIRQQSNCRLLKLSIIGGQLEDLGSAGYDQFDSVEVVHLRYLKKLKMNWHEFRPSFPNLAWLEILRCPNLISFPCDSTGVWEI